MRPLIVTILCICLAVFLITAYGCSNSNDTEKNIETDLRMSFTNQSCKYYSDDQQLDLSVYLEQVTIGVATEDIYQLEQWLSSDPIVAQPLKMEKITRLELLLVTLLPDITEDDVFDFIDRLNQSNLIRFATPVFGDERARTLLTEKIVVRFTDTSSVTEIEAFIDSLGIRILKRDFLWPQCYLLAFNANAGDNAFDVSRIFYESDLVEFAHPNFVNILEPVGADDWISLLEEDFEADFPGDRWLTYDFDPLNGLYTWGSVTQNSNRIGWPAGSVPGLDLDAGNNESYPHNMDSWMMTGPFDLSQTYWAQLLFKQNMFAPNTESFEWLASIDGVNWHGEEMVHDDKYIHQYSRIEYLNNTPGLGDLTGEENVWIAFRFQSDSIKSEPESDFSGPYFGVVLDDILLRNTNDSPYQPFTTDPFSNRQWNLLNLGQSAGEPGFDINVLEAWDLLENLPNTPPLSESVIVAVIDSGADLNHEDYTLVPGYDATYDPDNPMHTNSYGAPNSHEGHGTACAGIIGALNNDMGIVGVAPGVRIMPVRIFNDNVCETDDVAAAILWAAENGAKVLSNSWGGGPDTDLIRNALSEARNLGCTAIFASGNGGYHRVAYPARYETTFAVGAMSPCGEQKSKDSCDGEPWRCDYGPSLDVVAPGVMIPATDISGDGGYVSANAERGETGNYYMAFNGTSSACPQVAGVAALMLTANPDLSPDALEAILRTTAVDLGEEGRDDQTGWGLVNAHDAVQHALYVMERDLQILEWDTPFVAHRSQDIEAELVIEYVGPMESSEFYIKVFFSHDNTNIWWDDLLYETTIRMLPSQIYADTLTLRIPSDAYTGGSYLLILSVDQYNTVHEFDEGNNMAFASVQIAQAQKIYINPTSVDFGEVMVGSFAEHYVRLMNIGDFPLEVTGFSYSGRPEFHITPPTTPFVIDPDGERLALVEFFPYELLDYEGTLAINTSDPFNPEMLIAITGVGSEGGPILSTAPSTLAFVNMTTDLTFTVSNDGTGLLSWEIVDDLPAWLTLVSPMNADTLNGTPSDVTVTVDRTGQPPGTYTHNLNLSSNGGSDVILVVLTVPEPPVLSIDPLTIDFGEITTSNTLTISNPGGADLIWDITDDLPAWLTVFSGGMSGVTPSGQSLEVTLVVSRNLMAPGDYSHTISITSNAGNGSVLIDMTVPGQTLSVSPTSLDFGSSSFSDAFTIQNSGGFPLNWSIGDDLPTWLSVSPMSGSLSPGASSIIAVGITRDGLGAGTYNHMISIGSNGGSATVDISMTVEAAGPLWAKTYGGASVEVVSNASLSLTGDGGYIIAGKTFSFGEGNSEFWVVRLDSDGAIVWEKTYGGSSIDEAYAVTETSDGGYLVGGYTYSFSVGSADAWVIKLDASGAIQWQKTFGTVNGDYADSVIETFNSQGTSTGYIFTGRTSTDIWVIKLDSAGVITWQKIYGGSNGDYVRAIRQTSDGGYILAADTLSFDVVGRDMWLVKLDSAGDIVWEKTYGGDGDDLAYSISLTNDNGYVVTGYSNSFSTGDNDAWILKVNGSGLVQWQYTYGGAAQDYFRAVELTTDDGFVVTGWTSSFNAEDNDLWILKLNELGENIWQKVYDNDLDWGFSIRQTPDGGYAVIGETYSSGQQDLWLLRLGNPGTLGCGIDSDSTALSMATSISGVDSSATMATASAVVTNTNTVIHDTTATVDTQCNP